MRLVLDNVSFSYEASQSLGPITLTFEPGVRYGLVGPNGVGKTTFLELCAGLIQPKKGSIVGRPAKTALLDASRPFFDEIPLGRLASNICFPLAGAHRDDVFQEQFTELLSALGLEGDLKKPLGKFSKGMKQKALFLLQLLGKPELWLLDEPFDGLDLEGVQVVTGLLQQRSSAIWIVSSHRFDELLEITDRIMLLKDGQIVDVMDSGDVKKSDLEQKYLGNRT